MADSNPRRESPLDPADPVVAAVAERSGVDYGTAAEMLGDFMASLKRDQGVSE